MVMLYVMTFRTLKERLTLVDISLWPSLLGIPSEIIDQMWCSCRRVEINGNVTYPTILGPLKPGCLFRLGCMPTETQKNLQIGNPWMEMTLQTNCQEKNYHDFASEGNLDKEKHSYEDLKIQFENELYNRDLPAGGKFAGYHPFTGLPVSRCIVFQRGETNVPGEKKVAFWQHIASETSAVLVEEDHYMGAAQSVLFWPRGPTLLQNEDTRRDSKRQKERKADHDEKHQLSHAKREMKTAVAHVGQLDHQQRSSMRPSIDPDFINKSLDEMHARFESGAAQGLPGGYDMSDGFASHERQRASDLAAAKARLGL